MGVVSGSGGGNDMIADMASAQDIVIPEFAPQTVEGITPLLFPSRLRVTRWMSPRLVLLTSATGQTS